MCLEQITTYKNFQVEVTNDGATILKSIGIDNPAAKILVDMSKVQDDEVGDGTTSVTVLGITLFCSLFQAIKKYVSITTMYNVTKPK